jgi:glutamate dehydrogenase
LADDHFTFLGYREYELISQNGKDVLRIVPDSGLGILREAGEREASASFAALAPAAQALARAPELLVFTKANSRATVHRPGYLDYVGVKSFDEAGRVGGERRFLGLYTSIAYSAHPADIPVLRRKVQKAISRAGFVPKSHKYKALVTIVDQYPRDELFQITEQELYGHAMGILHLAERQRIRVFLRRGREHFPQKREVYCFVIGSEETARHRSG